MFILIHWQILPKQEIILFYFLYNLSMTSLKYHDKDDNSD